LIAVYPRPEVIDGVAIIPLPHVPRWQRPRLWGRLLQQALAARADIFHFHDPELLLVAPCLRLLTGKPIIYDVHEVYADFIKVKDYLPAWLRYPAAWIFRWLEPALARFQSGLIFADDEIAATFSRVDRPKATLFNFPSAEFVEEAGVRLKTAEAPGPVVLYLGGMERNRGADLLIDAFGQVMASVPGARLLVVGHFMPPLLEEEVRARAKSQGIDAAVTLTGRVPFAAIGDFLSRAAVGWVTWQPVAKNLKNIPTKLFEYMAYALPVVASDLRSTRPFVRPGLNGYLVSATDPTAHAAALSRLLAAPDEARAMGQRGRELVVDQYNWTKMEGRLLALYETLLS
jgi:glycosyltransferase involved in cell wall biosynthesis